MVTRTEGRLRNAGVVAFGLLAAVAVGGCHLRNTAPVPVSVYEKAMPKGQLRGTAAYVTSRGVGRSIIRVVDMATDRASTVPTPRGWVTDASLSPDGRVLAFGFGVTENAPSHIWLVRPDGGGLRQLTGGTGVELDPAWSPSGSEIVFSSFNPATGRWELETVPAAGGTPVQLGVKGSDPRFPAWSPKGSTIVYSARRGSGPYKLWAYDLTTHGSRQLTSGPGSDLFASFNRSGTEILFSSTHPPTGMQAVATPTPGQWQTYVRDGNGHVRLLINSNSDELWPVWSPSGHHVLVTVPHLAIYKENGKALPGGALRWRVLNGAQWSPSWR